jgi:hypothetical protein
MPFAVFTRELASTPIPEEPIFPLTEIDDIATMCDPTMVMVIVQISPFFTLS